MDSKKRISIQALYRQTLQIVGRERNPRDYFLEDIAASLTDEGDAFTFAVLIPLHDTFAFIINNRLILENVEFYMIQESGPVLTPEEIVDTLRPLLPNTAEAYLRTIDCGVRTMENLISAFNAGDKYTFSSIIKEGDMSLTKISNICNVLWSSVTIPNNLTFEEWRDYIDSMVIRDTRGLEEEERRVFESIKTAADAAAQWNSQDSIEQYNDFEKANKKFSYSHVEYLLNIYWEDPTLFTLNERKKIEEICHRPAAKGIYYTLHQQFVTKQDNAPFELSIDYFSLKNESAYTDDFFTLRYEVVKAGSEKLTQLINYLSECGYISNSLMVKQMFAYRLSGKQRPERIVPIEWHGRNGKSYELIYLIKCLTERADYRKMRRFFFGCEWVKDRDSSYAKNANYELKFFLHRLYNNIPDEL